MGIQLSPTLKYTLVLSGLFIGMIIGNLFAYRFYTVTLDQTKSKLEYYNTTIVNINQNIDEIMDRIDTIDSAVYGLKATSTYNSYVLDNLVNNMDYIENRISEIESDLRKQQSENIENLDKISDLNDHIEELYKEIGIDEGNKLYLEYDLWFEYSKDMNITTRGWYLDEPSDINGVVTVTRYANESFESVIFDWVYDIMGYYSENIEREADNLKKTMESKGYRDIVIKDSGVIRYNTHSIDFHSIEGKVSDEKIYGKIAFWYCDQLKRVYVFFYICDDQSMVESGFTNNLNHFKCHK